METRIPTQNKVIGRLVFRAQGIYPLRVEDILREIDAALERLGISARAASIRAQGAPETIRDMRRGHVPSVERLRSICEVLGLEFYVGPPRWRRAEDEGVLPDVPLSALERSARDLFRLTLEAGGNPIPDDSWPALVTLALAEHRREHQGRMFIGSYEVGSVLDPDTSWIFGGFRRPRTLQSLSKQLDSYVIALVAAKHTLAGQFISEPSPDEESGRAGDREGQARISSSSLEEHGIDPAHCFIVKNLDAAMEPTLPNGCVTMVDSESGDSDPSSIKAVLLDENVVFRRVVVNSEGRRFLKADNPGWPDEPWPPGAEIVGEVKWRGHWVR